MAIRKKASTQTRMSALRIFFNGTLYYYNIGKLATHLTDAYAGPPILRYPTPTCGDTRAITHIITLVYHIILRNHDVILNFEIITSPANGV